ILAKLEKDQLDQYKSVYGQLQQQQAKLQQLYGGLRRQEARTALIQGKLNGKKQEKDNLLVSIQNRKAGYEAELQELQKASRRLYEIINRSNLYSTYRGKGFRALKSRLPWPVRGAVVFGYGRGTDPVFGTPVFRNGIYIRTAPNATVRSIFTGKVVFANWFKGYGQLVIVDQGQGYDTLYADLSEIFLKVGDIIETRAEVGKAGKSVMVNGPSLYFEVRYRGKPLDPMQWLARN
ncbi:MAG: peptidoglycan DD-metalloendopeptidase family protein, partial [Nitrospiraceae bacterium]|nr:peptidoglycan DD-metalloendopeptidase family protein [Nitrospiraceae bacterium]